jgi:two-component system cell cycle response regulator
MTRILVVEDNPANRELMEYLLKKFGYTVLSAKDGNEGLKAALNELPDLIICDLHMPGLPGLELAKQIKAQSATAAIPLLTVTAFAMVSDRERALAAGFNGFISKPIVPETFVTTIEEFLPDALRSPEMPIPWPDESTVPPSGELARNGATVLVVDDLPANLDLMQYILSAAGYSVFTASNVMDGLATARITIPDVIISDTHMTPHSGFDLIKIARSEAKLRSVPVILTSASGYNSQTALKGSEIGASGFLSHPISSDTLVPLVTACLISVGTM